MHEQLHLSHSFSLQDREREDLLDQYRSLISANADLRTQAEQSQKEQDSSDATLNSLRQQLARVRCYKLQ